ncbi:ankyrin repeat domain-containing protein [Wolbachia endosymbiont of Nasonia giraulti]|uniref:ankyrin repeat domain-containing protein n=1 Tax=Wolbachia endosymbiont of Nasonia giraulti TaxID=180838 RepID=UPI003A846B3E
MYKTKETKSIELFAAIEKRDIKEVVRLINAEADVNAVDKNGAAPLHIAAVKDNAETIKVLIEAGADVNKVENSGKTPLHFAAFTGRSKAIKVLIDLGANIEAKDQKGRTPLHEANENLFTKGVKVLIEAGADVNAVDKDEFTPLYMPIMYGYKNVTDIVKLLIEAGADVNKVSMIGTPLHWAVLLGKSEEAKVLIEAGADVNKVENSGKTPLHYVATKNHTNICDIILNHIARLEIAGLYVSSSNSNKKRELISDSRNLHNDYLQYLENSRREVKKMEKENKPLYDFLKESDIAKLVSIFEKNEGVRSILDDQKGLRKQYSEYA